jgi:N-acetylglutamate synthase-like GNAT family acetyltransferase
MKYRLARPACREDWDVYHRIRQDVLLESQKYALEHPDEEDEPGHYPLLLWLDDRAIGTIRIDKLDADAAALRLIAIDPVLQGQGHGGALLREAERFACSLGCSKAVVYSTTEAIGYYEACGFNEDEWAECEIAGVAQMVKVLG